MGYSQYFHVVTPFFTIDDSLVKIPENFMEMVKKYNKELIERRKAVEKLLK